MCKAMTIIGVTMLIVSLAIPAWGSMATKKECIAKCHEAAELIRKNGIDTGIKAIGDKKGPFVWKDTYVFLMNMEGKMLAHPMKPALTKKDSLLKTPDATGRLFFEAFIKVAGNPGTGWVDYMWPKPGKEEPSAKSSYIYRIPGTPYFVGAGIYK